MSKIIGVTVGTPINPSKLSGKSAYQIALNNGFEGTEQEWLSSLKGEQGISGAQGPKGDKGDTGAAGKNGTDGKTPVKGTDYFTESDKSEFIERITNSLTAPDYVITEAESVIDRVIAAQGNRTFTFAAITDLHYGNSSYTDGVKHACQACYL